MAFLTFNEAHGPPFPTTLPEETEEAKAALKEQMPLKDTWWLWEQAGAVTDGRGATNYNESTRKIVPFRSVQEFWAIWNGIPQPSELLDGKRFTRQQANGGVVPIDALMIFKEGVKPEWEDAANATGGHFQVQLKLTPSTGPAQIDEFWNNVVLGMVGASLEPYDMITGVRLVDKLAAGKAAGHVRIELWFRRMDDSSAVSALKKNFERCLSTRLDGSVTPNALGSQKFETKGHASTSKH